MNQSTTEQWIKAHFEVAAAIPLALLWGTVGLWMLLGYSIGGGTVATNLGLLFSMPAVLVTVVYGGVMGYALFQRKEEHG